MMSGGYSMPLVDGMVVGDVLALLQTQNYTHSSCFLTDSDGQYLGVLELARLAGEDYSSSIASLMQRVPAYHVSLDQEQAVTLLSQSSIDCLPLIDSYGRPVGFFNSQQAISVMQREQTEDVEK